jgi:tetratricopeptide (TPR) repeat protein
MIAAACLKPVLAPRASPTLRLAAGLLSLHTDDHELAGWLLESVATAPVVGDPARAAAMAGLAQIASSAGELERAAALLERAGELDPASWEIPLQLSEVKLLAGNDVAALTELLRALERDPGPSAAVQARANPMIAELVELAAVREILDEAAARPGRPVRGLMPVSAWGVGTIPALGGIQPGTLAG